MSETKTIASLKRLTNSVNGNPRYRVRFTDGSAGVTKQDAGWAYELTPGSSRRGEGATVEVEHRGDRITMMRFTD